MRTILLLAAGFWLLCASVWPQGVVSIVPKPAEMQAGAGAFTLNYKTQLVATDATGRRLAGFFNDYLLKTYGFKLPYKEGKPPKKDYILFSVAASNDPPGLAQEAYTVRVTPEAVRIGGNEAGVFYGMQSLMQLLPVAFKDQAALPALEIKDAPRFRYRGMHLDVGRHLFPVEFIKKYIDLLAQYKMNNFHWHLTEDQGWRIEIKKYPKLTQVGGYRKETVVGHGGTSKIYDGKPYGGFYTQEQIKEVVAYAQARYVNVIPEIELPGHSQAAIAAYPEFGCAATPPEVATTWGVFKDIYCPKEETFKFLEDVLTEVVALFPGPYVHVGGDEAPKDRWKESAVAQEVIKREGLKDEHELQSYFIRRIEKFLNAKGKRLIGWDEILEGGLAPNATVMSWRGEQGGIEAARQKHDVIMTPGAYCYFDHYQGDPRTEPLNIGGYTTLSKVYSYNPEPAELTPEQHKYILGAQGNVWTEYMKTPEFVEYMVFPRLLALSEVLWTPQAKRDYEDFEARLPNQLARLDAQKVNYRIPEPKGLRNIVTPGEAEIEQRLASYVPDSKIYYTFDGATPDEKSSVYAGALNFRTMSAPQILSLIVVTPSGRKSAVYRATLLSSEYRAPLDYTANTPGLSYLLYEGRFDDVKAMLAARPKAAGATNSLGLAQFNRQEDYGVVWEGFLKVPTDGLYQFAVESDDGSALYIDGEMVVDNDGPHTLVQKDGFIALRQGFHRFRLAFFQRGGSTGLRVLWGTPGQPLRGLERNALFR
jgi:hexosaminidase